MKQYFYLKSVFTKRISKIISKINTMNYYKFGLKMHRGLSRDKKGSARKLWPCRPDKQVEDKEADHTFLRHPRQLRVTIAESPPEIILRRTLRWDTSLTCFTQDICRVVVSMRNFNVRSYRYREKLQDGCFRGIKENFY